MSDDSLSVAVERDGDKVVVVLNEGFSYRMKPDDAIHFAMLLMESANDAKRFQKHE